MKPILLVIAGPNGAGKTTVTNRLREEHWSQGVEYLYDNSVESADARLCARTQDGLVRKIYGALPDWVADAVEALARHPDFVDARQT